MEKHSKIYVAGHRGLAGSAVVRALQAAGYTNLLLRTSAELDLRNQTATADFFAAHKPEYVFLCAAKVGGIVANNTYRADFLYQNLAIQNNVIHNAYVHGVKKLLFLGSSCIYPKMAPQPLKEDYLLTGLLEPTNEPYAIAKIAGLKMCEAYRDQYGCNFISAMPTNLYGPGDNYDLQNSHVLPALLRKIHTAKVTGTKEVIVWGDGSPLREFLHADDMAAACLHLMLHYDGKEFVNVGSGHEISIKELAHLIERVVGSNARLVFDTAKPNGTPRKVLDVTKLKAMGWQAKINLEAGIAATYQAFLQTDIAKS
jgi:GDP-L-fucose synthase